MIGPCQFVIFGATGDLSINKLLPALYYLNRANRLPDNMAIVSVSRRDWDNEQWQAFRTLPLLKQLFEQDFPGIEVLPIDAFPQGNALIGEEETARLVKESGVDAVIIGNAA